MGLAAVIFLATLAATFFAAFLARRHAGGTADHGLAQRSLNRWLVGLSAGTTANSGFIVTGAVGLGYAYGMQWMLLPLSWLLGDLVFWHLFPARINAYGRASGATTVSEVITHGLEGRGARLVAIITALMIIVCLIGYTAAQWLAGQKFLSGAFRLPEAVALALFGATIIAYSAIGGFRGSVYTDALQALIRIGGTVLALVVVVQFALSDVETFHRNIEAAGPDFLKPFPSDLIASIGFVLGFAMAAIGFGLGQPQIVSRYLAGASPAETGAARWVYIGFLQFTWLAMTAFGIVLRGVMPGLADPEMGLSVFFQEKVNAFATGIIAADIFATIASTTNGLLIAMSQAVVYDLLGAARKRLMFGTVTVVMGIVSIAASYATQGTVLSLALGSVALLGAALAPAVMVKVLGWRHTVISLASAIVVGAAAAIGWKMAGAGAIVNEAGIGMLAGLATNCVLSRRAPVSGAPDTGPAANRVVGTTPPSS
jgi:sodium/proline symporter